MKVKIRWRKQKLKVKRKIIMASRRRQLVRGSLKPSKFLEKEVCLAEIFIVAALRTRL